MRIANHFCWLALVCATPPFLGLFAIPEDQENREGLTIEVGVEEVRLDAIVLDRQGHQVTNLTADDFEIRQDGRKQQITSCTYVSDQEPRQQKQPGTSRPSPPVVTATPTPILSTGVRRIIGRTIVFIVDNLSMIPVDVYRARMAVRRFIENQMQPGDLISVMLTRGGSAAHQTFSSDKQHLLSTIDKLRWFADSLDPPIAPQFLAAAYCIRALSEMPGRKSLIMISKQTAIPVSIWTAPASPIDPASAYTEATFNPLADAALRAGVVIHTLDIEGLRGPEVYDQDFGAPRGISLPIEPPPVQDASLDEDARARQATYIEARNKMIYENAARRNLAIPIPLSKKTGGLFIRDSNFFDSGAGVVNEALKGYYLLTYVPPEGTFRTDPKHPYHKINVKAKRSGTTVHSRDGFFGTTKAIEEPAGESDALRSAIFSPFLNSDLNISLASGYVQDAHEGYLLHSWLYLDARDLSISEEKNGACSIFLHALCVTSDVNNVIHDSTAPQYEFIIRKENLPWIIEHGLKFSMTLPIKQPGIYYVRAAVRDPASGKMGSAYQYVEIPDLKRRGLSLSNVFLLNHDEDAAWNESGKPQGRSTLLYPDMRKDPRKSPALRSFLPGESFDYAAVVYNATRWKGKKPDLESQIILFGNGKELFRGTPEPIDLAGVGDFQRVPIKKTMMLDSTLVPGDYALQLRVKDKQADSRNNLAIQTLDFTILKR